MQFKFINSKYKEIYFTPAIVQEEENVLESNKVFFNNMQILAYQNMASHKLK